MRMAVKPPKPHPASGVMTFMSKCLHQPSTSLPLETQIILSNADDDTRAWKRIRQLRQPFLTVLGRSSGAHAPQRLVRQS